MTEEWIIQSLDPFLCACFCPVALEKSADYGRGLCRLAACGWFLASDFNHMLGMTHKSTTFVYFASEEVGAL